MFDFRYHVVSLSAVFLALVLGMLVGAAISDPGLAERADRQKLREQVGRLEERLKAAESRSERDQAAQAYVDASYGAVMANRLAGRGIGVLVVGSVESELLSAVRTAVADDADGTVLRLRVVRPPDSEPIDGVEDVTSAADLGRRLGEEFVHGGETPVWDAASSAIVEQRSGGLAEAVQGVVVAVRPGSLRTRAAEQFTEALLDGLADAGVPVVGVERLQTDPSVVELFERSDASVVDDADTPVGSVSLVVVLAGGPPGHYGVKDGSDALVPPIEPIVPTATA